MSVARGIQDSLDALVISPQPVSECDSPVVVFNGNGRRRILLHEKVQMVHEAYPPPKKGCVTKAKTAVRKTGRKFKVFPSQLRRWKRSFDEIYQGVAKLDNEEARAKVLQRSCSNKKQRLTGGGRKSEFGATLVQNLKAYFDARRDDNLPVSVRLLIAEAKRLDKVSVNALTYGSQRQRMHRLLNRWDVTWRRGTHKAQNTRFASKIIDDFRQYVNEKMIMLDIHPEDVYNCDQTNVLFSMDSAYTYEKRGSKYVGIKSADSNGRATAMLACSLTGRKLPPFLIFRGSQSVNGRIIRELARGDGFPDDVELSVQPKAWMDEGQMLRWIDAVWKPHAVSQRKIVYLIMDECPSHLTSAVRRAFADCHTEVDYIPGGYTSKLQVLDVGVNKPFKQYLRYTFDDWLVANMNKRPERVDVAWWVKKAWDQITTETITNTWRKCLGWSPADYNDEEGDDPLSWIETDFDSDSDSDI